MQKPNFSTVFIKPPPGPLPRREREPYFLHEKLLVRACSCCIMVLGVILFAGCSNDGHFTIFNYTTRPNYDTTIRNVYVPIFGNTTFERGLEFDLTRAIIREIESKTSFKMTDCRDGADTELIGKIVSTNKTLITMNQLGEIREAQIGIGIELTWRDLRPGSTGVILSINPKKEEVRGEEIPIAKDVKPPPPVLVTPMSTYVPEVGGSALSSRKQLVDRAAIQIVSMMEKGW
jgi:hypothetical protein